MADDKKNSALRSPWVYGWILLVVVVLAVNFTMIMFSRDKNPGLVNDDFYERGQDYEKNMAERLAKNLQWKSQYIFNAPIKLNVPQEIKFHLENVNGEYPQIDAIDLYVYRPADAKLDFKQDMKQIDNYTSVGTITFPAKGIWDLLVAVKIGEEEFNFGKRVFVEEK